MHAADAIAKVDLQLTRLSFVESKFVVKYHCEREQYYKGKEKEHIT